MLQSAEAASTQSVIDWLWQHIQALRRQNADLAQAMEAKTQETAERFERLEQAIPRVPTDAANAEHRAAEAVTQIGDRDELPHDQWKQFKDRIWRAARKQREGVWSQLSAANKQKLGRIAGGMANDLATDESKFDNLVGDLVETFDRMLAEEGRTSPTPAPAGASSSGQGFNLSE